MKPLRVLHLDSGREWRGGQRQVLLLALGLRERGHEPFLIGAPDSPLVTRARAAGLPVATVSMRADWHLSAAIAIRARARAWKADVVHAHDARSHALALLALAWKRIPLVVTRRVPFAPRSVRLKYGPRVSRFIAVSDAVRNAMTTAGIDASRIDVVHSGIPIPAAKPAPRDWRAECDWPADSVICGVVGAMSREKGIDLLEGIAKSLPPESRERARFLLIGGTASGSSTIGGIAAHNAGFVERIEEGVAGLDILLHPARAEGLGTALLDAMAAGVPPVAFRTGGIPEVIEDGISGILVPAGDVSAFAAAADSLIHDPRMRRQLGARAETRVESFSAAKMTKGAEAVYHRVLTG